MEPELRALYGRDGAWHEIVAAIMELPDDLPATIAQMWRANQELAAAHQDELAPEQFAEMFVDSNFELD